MSGLFDHPFEEEPPAPEAIDTPRPRRQIVTVAELTAGIRASLESGFGELWVEGEISNCRVWNTGHVYFTLKDQAAQLKAVMFRSAYRYLKFKIDDGIHVVARGRLSVYEPKGEYQLVCEHLEPQGRGALQLAFEQLKRKLQAEGLFATARKRPLPALPRKIGIVTSLDGAALKDIIKVLSRRHPNAHLVLRPVRVQGDGAGEDIARALKAIAQRPGRGRRDRRTRRRFDRGSLGVQRGDPGAGDRGVPGAGHFRGRTRGRRHDRGLRRGPPRADAIGCRRNGRDRQGRVQRAHRSPAGPPRGGDAGRYPAPPPGPPCPDQPARACRLAGAGCDAGPAHLGADPRIAARRRRAGRAARARAPVACGATRGARRAPQPGGCPVAARAPPMAGWPPPARGRSNAHRPGSRQLAGRLESLSPLGGTRARLCGVLE